MLPLNKVYALCNEVNVIPINSNLTGYSNVVSSRAVAYSIINLDADGWGFIDLSRFSVTPTVFTAGDASGNITGLPVIAFSVVADIVTGTERGGLFPLRILVDEQ
jgi:hypothetical protein